MYLLDTNICIYAINRRPPRTIEIIGERVAEGLYVSALTAAELEYGAACSGSPERNRGALLKFLSIFTLLPFDDADAVEYGRMKAGLRRRGRLFGPIDMLLAAQARAKGLVFVTNNAEEFRNVEGLQIEDWK